MNGIPERRSVISGATKGTLDGSEFANVVNLGYRFLLLLIIQSNMISFITLSKINHINWLNEIIEYKI